MTDDRPGYDLVHPVYLDVPMMISFLAYLEGGISTNEEETRRESNARQRTLMGQVAARLPFLNVGPQLSAEGSTQNREESSLESKTQRHHTTASLFNLLYQYLQEDGQLTTVEDPSHIGELHSGQLVEIAGEYLGNPLEDVLALMSSLLPYVEEQKKAQEEVVADTREKLPKAPRTRTTPKGTGPAAGVATVTPEEAVSKVLTELAEKSAKSEEQHAVLLIKRMCEDLTAVPVHDLLLRTRAGLKVVLTASSEFYSSATNEYLRAGEFRVVGKVTLILTDQRTINLTRRTVMRAAGSQAAKQVFDDLKTQEHVELNPADPIVSAPAIQIIPMAIFL